MHHLLRVNNEYWNHERSLSALLIYLASSIFVWIPLAEYATHWWSFLISDLLFNLIVLSGVFSVLTFWRKQLPFIALAFFSSFLRVVGFLVRDEWITFASSFFAILFFVMLARKVLRHIVKDGPVNFYRIQGSVVVFMIIGIVYAFLYNMVEFILPGSFSITQISSERLGFGQFLYFSFVTMTTLGIGDWVPTGSIAKSLVVFQSMIGLLYPVIMIARLVSMEVANSTSNR